MSIGPAKSLHKLATAIEILNAYPNMRVTVRVPSSYIMEDLAQLRRLAAFFLGLMGLAMQGKIIYFSSSLYNRFSAYTLSLFDPRSEKNEL
ncbi:hypothetical protein AGMMS49992_27230 [Clostridia bacterium]|nr:hypothetical protein AGMMS49992_27230 [Clostridia bacterium]